MDLRIGGFEKFRGVEDVVYAVGKAERAGPKYDLFAGEAEMSEERVVGRTGAKEFGVGAVWEKKNFFSRDALFFLEDFDDPVGDGVDVGGAAVAPAFDSTEDFHDEAVFHEALINDDVGPEVGDVEDEGRPPKDAHEPRGCAKKKWRRLDKDVIGAPAAHEAEKRC